MNDQKDGQAAKDRRQPPANAMMAMIQQVHDNQVTLAKRMEAVPTELAEAIATLMRDAFPDGDPDGHRRYHESSIKQAEAKAEFWAKLQIELAKYGLIGFLGWAAYALWQAFLQGPHK